MLVKDLSQTNQLIMLYRKDSIEGWTVYVRNEAIGKNKEERSRHTRKSVWSQAKADVGKQWQTTSATNRVLKANSIGKEKQKGELFTRIAITKQTKLWQSGQVWSK